jgi:RND family efflux transporter MFP subunit
MELADLMASKTEVQGRLGYEKTYLRDSKRLLAEDIVSPQEVEKQQSKVDQLELEFESLKTRYKLTIEHLHPLAIQHARAKVSAAEQELELAQSQLSNSVVRAPTKGVVVYSSLHFGSEYRPVRVGDLVYANQHFMVLPDMQKLEVNFHIPESELSKQQEGQDVVVLPISYNDVRLHGKVTHISTAAQKRPNKPQWQRYFQVSVEIKQSDYAVRPGMSVVVHVLSYNKSDAIRVPRRMVSWSGKSPFVYIDQDGEKQYREINLGQANAEFYEVVAGLTIGDKVVKQ